MSPVVRLHVTRFGKSSRRLCSAANVHFVHLLPSLLLPAPLLAPLAPSWLPPALLLLAAAGRASFLASCSAATLGKPHPP